MLNRPARKASPTPRPAQISGAAWAVVSVMACQLPIEPAMRAPYALLTLSQLALIASDGRAKKYAYVERTSVSETIIKIAPTMKASTIAATVVITSVHGTCRRRFSLMAHLPLEARVLLGGGGDRRRGERLLGGDAGHHQAEHLPGGVRRHDPDQPAAVHHRDPVRQ